MASKKQTAAPAAKPYPCPCATGDAVLVAANSKGKAINTDKEGAAMWICSRACGFKVAHRDELGAAERCPADGAPVHFDANLIGQTCGGLTLRGWNRCKHCGGVWLTRRAIPHAGGDTDGNWTISGGGRSLNAGSVRLRPEAGSTMAEVRMVIIRASRMPAFERALAAIAADDLTAEQMRELARTALAIGEAAADAIEAAPGNGRNVEPDPEYYNHGGDE